MTSYLTVLVLVYRSTHKCPLATPIFQRALHPFPTGRHCSACEGRMSCHHSSQVCTGASAGMWHTQKWCKPVCISKLTKGDINWYVTQFAKYDINRYVTQSVRSCDTNKAWHQQASNTKHTKCDIKQYSRYVTKVGIAEFRLRNGDKIVEKMHITFWFLVSCLRLSFELLFASKNLIQNNTTLNSLKTGKKIKWPRLEVLLTLSVVIAFSVQDRNS